MALTELTAFDNAYKALEALDEAGRRRALQWLADALGQNRHLSDAANSAEHSDHAPAGDDFGAPATARPATAVARPIVEGVSARRGERKKAARGVARQGATGRAYRRMPDADKVMKAYRKVGSISGLAEHFDVPLHTANHWARRLRSDGHQIGRNG